MPGREDRGNPTKWFFYVLGFGLLTCLMGAPAFGASVSLGRISPIVPSAERPARSPSHPPPPPVKVLLRIISSRIVYAKSGHRDPMIEFIIKLSGPSSQQIRFTYSTNGKGGKEVKNVKGQGLIHAGDQFAHIYLAISSKGTQPSELVTFNLLGSTNAKIGQGTGTFLVPPIAKGKLP